MPLKAISVPPQTGKSPEGLLVLLHGWGANAQDVACVSSVLNFPKYLLLFPDAPFPFPYAPGGRMWYNFPENFAFESSADLGQQPELLESRRRLTEWLQSLPDSTGVPLSRTILGGFSQGGAMTLDVGLRLPLAGLIVLSGYLHTPLQAIAEPLPPVLMAHGTLDEVVPVGAARDARDQVRSLGVNLDYQEFTMGHEISLRIIELVQNFTEEIQLHSQETA